MIQIRLTVACAALLLLAACGGGGNNNVSSSSLPAPDGQGHPGPAAGASYEVTIKAADGNNIAFTVHEPQTLTGSQKYPLLMNGPGFDLQRTSAMQRDLIAPAGTPLSA